MPDQTLLGLFDGYMSRGDDALPSETKLGGSPVYLPPLTSTQQGLLELWTRCGVCGRAMFLLLQAYSPLPLPTPTPHHRMLYVFGCNTANCARQPSRSCVAFSLQVDRYGDEIEADNAREEGKMNKEDALEKKEVEEKKEEDVPVLEMGPLLPGELAPGCFPPCFIDVVAEPAEAVVVPTDVEREMIRMMEANARAAEANHGVAIPDDDLKELAQVIDLKDKRSDYYYDKFRARLARAPTQVLRYHERTAPSSGPSEATEEVQHERPLFMNPQKLKLQHSSIPACSSCGAPLAYELQIMPTSLYYMRVHEYVDCTNHSGSDEGIDFGTITLYTCSKSCALREKGVYLRREVLVVEDAPQLNDDSLFNEAPVEEDATSLPGPRINLRNSVAS